MVERSRAADGARRKILYVVTEDWFFASHFLPMARAANSLGLEVVVATRVARHRAAIEREGIRVVPLQVERGQLKGVVGQVRSLTALIAAEQPTIVHCIALRSILVGGRAAARAGIRRLVLAPTGLGNLWTETGMRAALGRRAMLSTVRRLRGADSVFLFENHDDALSLGLSESKGDRVAFVNGAGVDPVEFPVQPMPAGEPLRLAMVARMLWPKGPAITVEAFRLARRGGLDVELDLYGLPDPSNALSVPVGQLWAWGSEPGIRWHGQAEGVPEVWRQSHIAVLPTYYREGLPRALIEAMASGRPILTTDVPGCRELIRDGVEGLLVPPRDPASVATAIARLAGDRALVHRMGAAARRRFEEHYTVDRVMEQMAAVYRSLLP